MIAIINYGSGNISAISNIYEQLKRPYKIVNNPEEVKGSDRIILPGVGAFDETMSKLNCSGFKTVLDEEVLVNRLPVLGICVGMQILAKSSEEGTLPGLGWIDGTVKKINKSLLIQKPKIPHLGWNSLEISKMSSLFDEIDVDEGFYFLHSYYFECAEESSVLSRSFYGMSFASSINKNNIYGVQFHPEKSHHNGVKLLENFARLNA